METKCHDFFECTKQNCAMFKNEEKSCWEIEPELTLCTSVFVRGEVKLKNKLVFCKNRLFYQLANVSKHVEPNIKFHSFC